MLSASKTGAIYFLFEAYDDIDNAKKRFSDVFISNRSHGMVTVANLGDEASYHTDHENFDLIMVRKDRLVFNIKVNKRTSTTTLAELKKVAAKITAEI